MLVNSKSILVFGTTTALAIVAGQQSLAGTQTTTFTPTANVVHQCNAVTATALAFGTYTPDATSAKTATSTIKVKCTKNSPVTIALDKGMTALGAAAGTLTQRRLVNGTNFLNYNIYTNASYTTIWGDGTAGTFTQSGALSKTVETMSWVLYGRIPAGQLNAAPGTYTDTVQVTVTF